MLRSNPYKWWNIFFYLIMIAVNAAAILIPLGGMTTRELSDKYHTLVTPAGYAFMIWSLIYLLLAGFCVYQFRRFTEHRDSDNLLESGLFYLAFLMQVGFSYGITSM